MEKIIGQGSLINELSRIFEIFKTSACQIRPHFILTGESGSGKSFTIKTLAEDKDLNYLEINAAQLTKEGTSGNSLSKALSPLLLAKNKPTIIFVDEFDKLFISGNSNSELAHEVTTGVQNEFLKVLESDIASVFGDYGKYINADMSKTLFVFAGAFNNEDNITIDKLRTFGVKTEFLGRVGLVYNTKKLTLEDFFVILENSTLLSNYLNLFDNVKRSDVITAIKDYLTKIYENNTLGARIIHTLIHQYFIKGGNLDLNDVEPITFKAKLTL